MGERQPQIRIFRRPRYTHNDPASYGPLRARDLHGPNLEGPIRYAPVIVDGIPVLNIGVDAIRTAFILYNIGRGFAKGDELRMDKRAKNLKTDSKKTEITKKTEFLEEYLLDRFDRVNRLAKDTYHTEKLKRAARRFFVSTLSLGAAYAAYKYAPGFDEIAHGWVADGLLGITGASTFIEMGTIVREADERRRIRKRAGKMRGKEYTDGEFKAQVRKAVDVIEMPGDREKIANKIYQDLDTIRHKKWKAFNALPQEAKDSIVENAKQIELIDYLREHPIRPTAFITKRRMHKKLSELQAERSIIRREADYVYVPPQNLDDTRDNGRYVRTSTLIAR